VLSFLREQDHARKPVRDLYNSLVVLDILGDGQENFENYLESLKVLYEQQQKPVTSIFLFYGNHVTCGQMAVNKTADGEYEVKMLYIDSSGRGKGGEHPAYWLVSQSEKVFPKQVQYYVSEIKNQHAQYGCSVFALMHVYDLIHLNETFADYAKAGLHPYEDIFDYISHNTTAQKTAIYYHGDDPVKFNYRTVLPPLAFSRGKQTMTRTGTDDGNPDDDTLVIGYMGLPYEIANSSKERQKELALVVNHGIPVTMENWLKHYLRPVNDKNNESVIRNQTVTLLIGQMGLQLAPWLAKQPIGKIKEYTSAFTLKKFNENNKIAIEYTPIDPEAHAGP